MPGVTVVHDGNFVGITAPTEQEAERAAAAIRVEWKSEQQPSGKELFEYLKTHRDGRARRRHQRLDGKGAGGRRH